MRATKVGVGGVGPLKHMREAVRAPSKTWTLLAAVCPPNL